MKKKLLKQLKEKNPQLSQLELFTIIDIFSNTIFNALKDKKNVEIRSLGRWSIKKLKVNHNLRNPASNELIYRPERFRVKFKASRKLNKLINE